ncbi:thiamine pyrophosphate-dependent enzyme [Bradyrhizobium sp. WYCCWR 13023]|uniref:Thiamine pyrophosphate-dependent enzyme n=1 Tax=Bradyrhizobium zhengyangense TaxID=2911009 RepID=A0A9X1RG53_9BRAD|nr:MULTISPECIES: thiamine pyrophosphate-dependent enzyme [Bradyrhizobium]MCG2630488.1 thiamine pyrophosphate-dependent enzyme [Bradyrhizobium zhengyangense]MCG2640693.1 thiamine pyrophosphate-dependent enzyme [Bradyrhizobium zhengyangense]MDA9518858.1 aldehyde dehydrogenase [Bradyrhizobium sp. CCBAU 11434]
MTVESQLDRRAAVAALLKDRGDLLVVSGLGSPTYDLHATGDRDDNFYLWGAMGGAALIGLGLAQAQRGKRVLALTGDGEQLMGLGGIATIGVAQPRNLDIVVIDNQHFGETGMQASHTGRGVDLTAIATACGFAATATVRTLEEVQRLAGQIAEPAAGPRLFVIKVRAENPPRSLPSRDAVFIKNRFRAHLGFAAA